MTTAYATLFEVSESLLSAYEKATGLAADFTEAYEGIAVDEVVPFLESLPQHIYKLKLFYGKMAQYVAITSASFSTNDKRIADNMEK